MPLLYLQFRSQDQLHKSLSSCSLSASRRSGVALSEDEEDEDEVPKKKGKSSGKSRTSQAMGNSKALASSGASGGGATFLTGAEQCEQGKKEEKKAAESPYSFLADNIRDVSKLFFLYIVHFLLRCIKCIERGP